MKNRSFVYLLLGCLMVPFFIACSDDEGQKETKVPKAECNKSPVNPNGDSELALLMRKMVADVDSLKQQIATGEGNISDELIAELERVHTAVPTDPKVKTDEFKAYNELLVNEAKALKETTENKAEKFNQFVNRCIDCHQMVCPGPIKRISKLKIVNPVK